MLTNIHTPRSLVFTLTLSLIQYDTVPIPHGLASLYPSVLLIASISGLHGSTGFLGLTQQGIHGIVGSSVGDALAALHQHLDNLIISSS